MRVAWFTPWPPQVSGIAGRSAELVPMLAAAGHGIDVCVDEQLVATAPCGSAEAPRSGEVRVQSAHDFLWRALRRQYDLVVYQLGNSHVHDFTWPYVLRWPGLAVLHDVRLHHARAQAHLKGHRAATYRAEFASNEPDTSPDAAELAVAGFGGTYLYIWPMVRDIVTRSRRVAVHSPGARADLAEMFPDYPIELVTLGEGRDVPFGPDVHERTRATLGISPDAVVFGVFGGLTVEKRTSQILRAFRAAIATDPRTRLLLAGPTSSTDWLAVARTFGVDHAVVFAGALNDDAFDQAIATVDVSLNLRWPSALETSGPWLRALAAGRATVVTDLAHQTHVPSLDPRTWQRADGGTDDAVTVAVDILDEDHSLALAMRRLAVDASLRQRLGASGRMYWEQHHSVSRMRDDYLVLFDRIAAQPQPEIAPPVPVVYDPSEHARSLVADFGDVSCRLF